MGCGSSSSQPPKRGKLFLSSGQTVISVRPVVAHDRRGFVVVKPRWNWYFDFKTQCHQCFARKKISILKNCSLKNLSDYISVLLLEFFQTYQAGFWRPIQSGQHSGLLTSSWFWSNHHLLVILRLLHAFTCRILHAIRTVKKALELIKLKQLLFC